MSYILTDYGVPLKESTPDIAFRVKKMSYDDGYSQIAKDGINNKNERWTMRIGATAAQYAAFVAAMDACGGADYFEYDSKKYLITSYSREDVGTNYIITAQLEIYYG